MIEGYKNIAHEIIAYEKNAWIEEKSKKITRSNKTEKISLLKWKEIKMKILKVKLQNFKGFG